jgi:hypothetical protein
MAQWVELDLKRKIIFEPFIKKHAVKVADI